jgi:WD40 repeat protein
LLQVEPVTSPTDERSQTITVRMGNMEAVTITAESGVFTAVGSMHVDVDLLPDTTHHLEVVARVKKIRHSNGCEYGGYTLRTRRDRNDALLVIEQGKPRPPREPTTAITPDAVSQLEPLLALTPDARLTADFVFNGSDELISVGYASHISRWLVTTGQETGRIGDGLAEAAALSVAVSPDRSLIATGGTAEDRSVRLWSAVSEDMKALGRHESHPQSMAFSPSGTLLASGDKHNQVRIWDVASGQPISSFEGDVPQRSQSFHSLSWLDDETLVAGASDAIFWFDLPSGQLRERLTRPPQAAFFVDAAFGQSGQRLAAVAQDENVYVWDQEAATWTIWPGTSGASLSGVEFSPDEQLLVAATYEGELLFWSVTTGELLASLPVASGSVAAIRFSPDGRYIAVGGWDSPIWLWGLP